MPRFLLTVDQRSAHASQVRHELDQGSDELDDAARAFLALALHDLGRHDEALALALTALAPHLPRYQRSLANYAGLLGRAEH